MPLGDLLQWLSMTRRTGILSLDRGAVHKELFFHEGSLISASSSDPREFLSQIFLSQGVVAEREIERLYRHIEENGGKLGQLMVEIGLLTLDELQRYLRLKAEESIYDCFLWIDGSFHFFIDEVTSGEHLPIVSELNAIIFEGLRRADEWRRIHTELPLPDPLVARSGAPAVELSAAARQLHELLGDEPRRLSGLGLELHWPDFPLYSAAAELCRAGAAVATPSGAAPQVDNADDHLERELLLASEAFARKEFGSAKTRLQSLLRQAPHHPAALDLLQRITEKGRHQTTGMLSPDAIPFLLREPEESELASLQPAEQFLVSRIDNQRSVADLIHIAPLRETEVRDALNALRQAGLVKLRRPTA